MKLKKKTLYNILMIAAIAVIAALAVFFAGRHLGWFDKPVQSHPRRYRLGDHR